MNIQVWIPIYFVSLTDAVDDVFSAVALTLSGFAAADAAFSGSVFLLVLSSSVLFVVLWSVT
jgi:hypothetical protein